MKFELFDYQEGAAAAILDAFMEGITRHQKNGGLTAVSLSAPTASGKTVIATSVIEQLFYGSDFAEPKPETTVLWVTDDPSLNQQTMRKMLQSSSLLQPSQLVVVDQSLDQKTLNRGKVYFVHIQQLGKGATNYVRIGDGRQYSLWETIGNTISTRGDGFLLIVDEAHRGTGTRSGKKTITAQIMDGAGGDFPPASVVLGITATPERFLTAIAHTGRVHHPVEVDPDAVRQSGLIKDVIRIRHPQESQPEDSTLLGLAVKDLKDYDMFWAKYATDQDQPRVAPALVVQVKAKASDAEITSILDALTSEWNILDGKAVGHSFQEHSTLNLGSRNVRYIAPQDIQDDPILRVVLFKEALTTGWDCPRAEVMFSFRTAQDYTYIAQLIGRMVRTPLARRIATDDFLNSVALYLPHYDDENVAKVVTGLTSREEGVTSAIEIDSVTCGRNPAVPAKVWTCFERIATYTRPAKYHRNDVARLNVLATLLVGNEIDISAIDVARKHITDTLDREARRLGKALRDRIADLEKLEYQTLSVNLATGAVSRETNVLDVNARNIDDLFRQARRTFGDSAAKWFWDVLCERNIDADDAKIEVAALAEDDSVAPALEAAANELIASWRKQHNRTIGELPDAKRSAFYRIWETAKKPEQVSLIMPAQVTAADKIVKMDGDEQIVKQVPRFKLHVYSNGNAEFPATFTGWEKDVLESELTKKTLVGWYRNPTGGSAALAVPYEIAGVARTMYPDFIFFHKIGTNIAIDIVDPHRPDSSDTGPKWTGLARYAAEHGNVYRRVVAVLKNTDGQLMSLDLKNPDIEERLVKATNEVRIRRIFEQLGGTY